MEVKTKIAYTINGLVSGISGKNSAKNSDEDRLLVLKYVSDLLNKNIVHCEQSLFVLVYLKNHYLFELSYGDDWNGILRNYYSNNKYCYYYEGYFDKIINAGSFHKAL